MGNDPNLASRTSTQPEPAVQQRRRRGWAVAATVVGGAVVVLWFLFAWLVLSRNAIDAAGESVGTAFAGMLLVALVSSLRRSGD